MIWKPTRVQDSLPVKIPDKEVLSSSLLGVFFEYERQKQRRSPKKIEKMAKLDLVINDLRRLIEVK